MELISSSEPVSRRQHRCDACYNQIPVKTRYSRAFWKDGGDAYEIINCLLCRDLIWEYFRCNRFEDEVNNIFLVEWARENKENSHAASYLERIGYVEEED